MQTYLIYSFILFGTTWAAYLYEKTNYTKKQNIAYFFVFFIPFIFMAIRYDIGTDYKNYVILFEMMARGEVLLKEPGYMLVNHIISYLGLDVQWLFVFFSFFTLLFAYKGFPKEHFAISIFLFITIFYLYYGFSVIRQGLGVSIMLYATKYLYNKDFKKYLLFSILASSFHFASALFPLLLYPIVNTSYNRFFMLIALAVLTIIVTTSNVMFQVYDAVKQFIPAYKDLYTVGNSAHALRGTSAYGIYAVIIKILPVIVLIYYKDKIASKYSYGNIVINFTFVYGALILSGMELQMFDRLRDVFILYFILSLVYFVNIFKRKKRLVVMLLICLLYFAWFVRYINIATEDIDNGQNVRPYKTILFNEK